MAKSDLKTRERFPSTISKSNLAELRALSKKTKIPMSTLIDEGLELLFKQYGVTKSDKHQEKENT